MQLSELLDFFIGAIINVLLYLFLAISTFDISPIHNKNKEIKTILVISIALCIVNIYNKDFFKTILTIPLITLEMHKLFKTTLSKSLLYTLSSTFYLLIGELLVGVLFSILPYDYTFIFNNFLGKTSGCIIVAIFTLPFLYIKKIKIFFKKISNDQKIVNKMGIVLSTSFFIIFSILMYKNSRGINDKMSNVVNIIIFLVCIIIIYYSYKQFNRAEKLSEEYNDLLKYLEMYEKEIVDKRKMIHDYRNQLIIIKGYANNSKKLKDYLNELLIDQNNANKSNVIKNIDKLPKGIKGLIYYKLMQVNNKINLVLIVKGSLKNYDKINPKQNLETLKIIGILLDNAIEATLNSKEKNIEIILSIEKTNFKCLIKNTFSNKIEKSKIMNLGYSTKGSGRGYGLSIVGDIVKRNKTINFKVDIQDNIYMAKLIVKI